MTDGLVWWLTVELIGAIAFPIGFLFFRFLPDRGYSFSKVLGLLLMTFLLWAGAMARVIPNDRWAIALILVGMAIASAVLAVRERRNIGGFLRDRWRYVLLVEALFTLSFVTAVWLRSYLAGGDLLTGEKPVQYAFLNATLRADYFPVEDPWFSGNPISYYYFGLIKIAALTKLTGIPSQITFNLSLALTAALTASAAFGVVFNLVAAVGRQRQAVVFGLIGVVLLLLVGNLEGLFELLALHDIGPDALYQWLNIEGLDKTLSSSKWYPSDEQFWWVRNRHIPNSWDIKEVPFWSFQLGDNSPHVIVLPFTLMATGAAFNMLRHQAPINLSWIRTNPARFLMTALVLGSLSFLNSWSFPPVLALIVIVVLVRNWWQSGENVAAWIGDTLAFSVLLTLAAVLMFVPFYWDSREALWPLSPIEVADAYLPLPSMVTQPKHLFVFWGPMLWLIAGLAVAMFKRDLLTRLGIRSLVALVPGLLVLLFWAVLVVGDRGAAGLWDEIQTRGANWVTVLILFLLLAAVVWGGLRFALSQREQLSESLVFTLAVVGTAIMVIMGTEFFFQDAPPYTGSRLNTVFKLYHHSWIFLSVGSAFGLYYVLTHLKVERYLRDWSRILWATVAVVLVAAAMVFAPMVILSRTNALSAPQSLDSFRFSIQLYSINRYEAVVWLNENVSGTPVVLQAELGHYGEWGISSFTGLPTVLGLAAHERQYRGSYDPIQPRQIDIETAYTTLSVEEARAVLQKYEVTYVYVGPYERSRYGTDGLSKLSAFMDVVFQNDEIVIYKMRD